MENLLNITSDAMLGANRYKTGFHHKPLLWSWHPVINVAVLIATMRWWKYSFYLHVLITLTVIGLTLAATINLLIDDWVNQDRYWKIQYVHNITGLGVVILLGLIIITGITARAIQYSSKLSTRTCIWLKRCHYIVCYLTIVAAKFNILNTKFMKEKYREFYQYLGTQIIFFCIYLWLKRSYWTLSEEIVDTQLLVLHSRNKKQNIVIELLFSIKDRFLNLRKQIKQKSFQIRSIKNDLSQTYNSESQIKVENYVLFKDYVYDTSKMKYSHPGGEYVIKLMNKRQVDRFLYGNYGPQLNPNTKIHDHSNDSMRLCGLPIAKIVRQSPMKGFDALNKFVIASSKKISKKGSTFVVHLKPISKVGQDWKTLQYEGYKDQSQIGQHVSLTVCNSKGRNRNTRLYTTAWSLRQSNIEFMEKTFQGSTHFNFKNYSILSLDMSEQILSNPSFALNKREVVPLIIKKYQTGSLTKRLLIKDFSGEIIVSQPLGGGMKYHTLRSEGKVILVCGGTGLLPFCDFIDLLFKRVKLLQGSNLSESLKKNDPIIQKDLIKKRQFQIFCALDSAFDLPPVSFYEINYLSCSAKISFKATFRIKKQVHEFVTEYPHIKLQQSYFDNNIRNLLNQNICKIFICGPPKMNFSMGQIMVNNKIHQDLYHFM